MAEIDRDKLVKKVSARTGFSEALVEKFDTDDLNGYFNRLANPVVHMLANNVSRGFMIGAMVGYFNHVFTELPAAGFVAFAIGMQVWNQYMGRENKKAVQDMTSRIADNVPEIPRAIAPMPAAAV